MCLWYNVRCTRRANLGSSLRSHLFDSPAGELGRSADNGKLASAGNG